MNDTKMSNDVAMQAQDIVDEAYMSVWTMGFDVDEKGKVVRRAPAPEQEKSREMKCPECGKPATFYDADPGDNVTPPIKAGWHCDDCGCEVIQPAASGVTITPEEAGKELERELEGYSPNILRELIKDLLKKRIQQEKASGVTEEEIKTVVREMEQLVFGSQKSKKLEHAWASVKNVISRLTAENAELRKRALTDLQLENIDMENADLQQKLTQAEEWKKAIIDAAVVDWVYTAEHETNPRKAVNDLLCWQTQLALDPKVSEEAAKLVQRAEQAEAKLRKVKAVFSDLCASIAPIVPRVHWAARFEDALSASPTV